jgi:hypothetical protein
MRSFLLSIVARAPSVKVFDLEVDSKGFRYSLIFSCVKRSFAGTQRRLRAQPTADAGGIRMQVEIDC